MKISALAIYALGMVLMSARAPARDFHTRPEVRQAVKRIERDGDRFKHAYKEVLEYVSLSAREKRVRELAEDLEDEVDNLKKNYKDGRYPEGRANLDNAMLLAASIDRFMQRNYFGPEARAAWGDLRSDLNVIARAYNIPELPVLRSGAVTYGESASSADRIAPPGYDTERRRSRLEREVRHELVMLPYYGVFDNLQFRVNGDTVTLMRQVTRPTLKSAAERVVKDVEGVDRVINKIEVLPLSANDDRIRIDLFRAIYGHTALNRYAMQAVPPIHIIVRNGNATLEGVVATPADRDIAGIQARSVPGVFSVTNNLRVQ